MIAATLRPPFENAAKQDDVMSAANQDSVAATLSGPNLCYCLAGRRSARFLTRLYERHLAPSGIKSSELSILSFLILHPGMTLAELGGEMEMERTTLLRTMKPIEAAGWVTTGPNVGRAKTFKVTPEGVAKVEEATPLWAAAQRAFELEVGSDVADRMRAMANAVTARTAG